MLSASKSLHRRHRTRSAPEKMPDHASEGTAKEAPKIITQLLLLGIVYGMVLVGGTLSVRQTREKYFQQIEGPSFSSDSKRQFLRGGESQTGVNVLRTSREDTVGFTLWSKDDTYFEACRKHYIGNHTWGRPLTNFVDKARVKGIVEAMDIEGLKIPRTLALYDMSNLSEFTVEKMRQIPQPYIIKPTHMSGSVSRVKDDVYECIKGCSRPWRRRLGKGALNEILRRSRKNLRKDHSMRFDEPQYKDIPPRIMVEEDVRVHGVKSDVSYWYASNGRPLFVSVQCSPTGDHELGTEKERAFVNTNFQRLNLHLNKPPCPHGLARPGNWGNQVEVATALAKGAPGIVRIDLYASENDIFFSEFTYTTSYCRRGMGFHPRAADGLLHAVQHGAVDPATATPEFVARVVHDGSWVFLALPGGRTVRPESSRSFPSPVDLCEHAIRRPRYEDEDWQDDEGVTRCLAAMRGVATAELHCAVGADDGSSPSLNVFSDEKRPTFRAVMAHVDWDIALALSFAVAIMTCTGIGTTRRNNQYLNNVLYLAAMLIVLRLTVPTMRATFSEHSVLDVARQSFAAFAYVHPMSSPHIALSHFATYWFKIASWRSKSPRNLLAWQLLVETVTAGVNEYCHLIEELDTVHCTRVAFKKSVKLYAFDELVRVYVLPPFFVYGYLLPKFIIHWAKVWVAMPLLALLVGVAIPLLALLDFYASKIANEDNNANGKERRE